MLPSPSAYGGGFPPRDPRLPSLGRYPEIVGGSNLGDQVMAAFEERHAPIKEIAYARTGRAPQEDAETQASGEMASGPEEGYDEAPRGPSVLQRTASGMTAGARHFYAPSQVIGYGIGSLGSAITGMAIGGVKALVNAPLREKSELESDEEPEPPASEPKPQEAVPAYLLDRERARPKKMSMIEKERIRIREKAAMEGEHPFHPWR